MIFLQKYQSQIDKYLVFGAFIYFISSILGDAISIWNNNVEYREVMNFYVRWLQNFLFFGVVLSIFMKIKNAFAISTIIGYIEVEYSLFANTISPLVVAHDSQISPEYARIVFFILILIAMLIKLFIKREKFKDIFLVLSMLGVIVTSILFHIITTSQLDYFTKNQEEKLLKIYNQEELRIICKIDKLECEEIKYNNEIKNKLVANYYNNYSVKEYMNVSTNYFRYQIISDNEIKNRIQARKPLTFIKNKDGAFYILDNNNYTNYLKFNEVMFGILALFSHLVWVFGALYLIKFHMRRKNIKMASPLIIENNLDKNK